MEIVKDGYSTPVNMVAEELLPGFSEDQLSNRPWINYYLPHLRKGLDRTDYWGTRDETTYAHYVLSFMTSQMDSRVGGSPQGIASTVAAAILMEEPMFTVPDQHPSYVRFLFDLSLGVARSDYLTRQSMVQTNADYEAILPERSRLQLWANHWQLYADHYHNLQLRLRDRGNITQSPPERLFHRLQSPVG